MSLSYSQRRSLSKRANQSARRWDAEAADALEAHANDMRERALTALQAAADVDAGAPCDVASLRPGDLVRDRFGWHTVVRVNAKSVTVACPWSWTERISKARIIETRSVK